MIHCPEMGSTLMRCVRPIFAGISAGMLMLALQAWEGAAMGNSPVFRFEDYSGLSNEEAKKAVSEHLEKMFPSGSLADNPKKYLENAGAKCQELAKYPGFYYCTYNHSAGGIRSIFVTIEWKILIWYSDGKRYVSKIEVNRGATGP
ncbi:MULTISPECIES: hypothetical protein [Azospirillum]|jgi:hypothetical protein|uniref:DUF3887 domain-containing protein n=1 Tax=Azospirillum brasilense TaxID=192 RepID=A0ABU4P5A0_AZOBR|nr:MULTISPECIES: hypothetical protein [Azospirillum]MDW7557804.1 hypothetical protein [Azospirillum brasilense]MDW7597438.1 hypothetical protein [Azospirillum brasilense]MDW7632701.1 hypothetical protein [Azospirillum brasilense]MDX5952444.1 hypothetical protein [Azospirillum brasilense]